jgi:hypothetical protein
MEVPSNKWPIQLTFLLFTVCMIFLSSLTLCNIYSFPTQSVQLISICGRLRNLKRFEVCPLLSESKHTDWVMDRHPRLCILLSFYCSVWINLGQTEWILPQYKCELGKCMQVLGRATGSFVLSVELQQDSRRKRLIARQQYASSSRRNTVLEASPTNTAVSVHRLSNLLLSSCVNTKRAVSSE